MMSNSFIPASSIQQFLLATICLDMLALQRPTINAERLAAHLLQHAVDERASEHVEKTGSNPSIDP